GTVVRRFILGSARAGRGCECARDLLLFRCLDSRQPSSIYIAHRRIANGVVQPPADALPPRSPGEPRQTNALINRIEATGAGTLLPNLSWRAVRLVIDVPVTVRKSEQQPLRPSRTCRLLDWPSTSAMALWPTPQIGIKGAWGSLLRVGRLN